MKDGRTHLAHKAEHAVDMQTGVGVAVTVQAADAGHTHTVQETLAQAREHLEVVAEVIHGETGAPTIEDESPAELVTDKGYHSREVVRELAEAGIRSYNISEPERGRQRWHGQSAEQAAVYGIGGACKASAASTESDNEARNWSERWRTFMKPAGCDGCTYAAITTSSSDC